MRGIIAEKGDFYGVQFGFSFAGGDLHYRKKENMG
jgi:hypothetical protein